MDPRFWPLWEKWVAWQKESGPVSAEVAAASEAAAPAATVVGNVVAGPAPEQVANYVRSLTDFTMEPSPVGEHDHMGAIIAEAILQAGINYRNVVLPRVRKLRDDYPDARTTSGFAALLLRVGTAELLQYSGEKVERVEALTQLLLDEQVETKADLQVWLAHEGNLERLRELSGIGPKTVDYLQMLAGLDTSAIDRHLALFLEQAGVAVTTYAERKAIIDAAADLLGVTRVELDYSIWKYMADRAERRKSGRAAGADEDDDGGYAQRNFPSPVRMEHSFSIFRRELQSPCVVCWLG